jgi:membrane protein implicated in regulation of membrane protease activity
VQLEPWHAWIVAGVVLLIVEVFTPGFVVACFGVGCLAAGLVSPLGVGLFWEIAVFCVASLAMLVGIRPVVSRHLAPKGGGLKTNADALVGKRGLVTEALDPVRDVGRVLVGGEDWRASPEALQAIAKDASVIVVRVEGARVVVRPL